MGAALIFPAIVCCVVAALFSQDIAHMFIESFRRREWRRAVTEFAVLVFIQFAAIASVVAVVTWVVGVVG